jgi:type II secretion system protein N
VKRLSKVILITIAVILVVAVVAVFGLRSYVQGDAGRARAEESISRALKVPVKIRAITLEFPSTLFAENLSTTDTGTVGQPKISAHKLHGTLALRPLLSGSFEIRDVTLDQPNVDWPQAADGRWEWPSPEKVKSDLKKIEPKVEKAPSQKTAVLVRGVKITNGTLVLRGDKQQPVLAASGLAAEFSEINEQQLIGAVSADRMAWLEAYVFEKVSTKVSYARDVLKLEEFDATVFDGTVHGSYEIDTKTEGQPFKTNVNLKHVDLDALATAAGWTHGEVTGRLFGEAQWSGLTDRIARIEGPGHLAIENGRFKKLEVFESVAQLVGLGELANFQPRTTTADFQLRDEKAFFESLVLATDTLRISAKGVARFDDKLDLEAQLAIPERLLPTIPEIARDNFVKLEDGMRGLDFKIYGKASSPKTDLDKRLIGGKVQDKIADLLGNLFGNKPEKKEEKKKEEKKKDEKKKDAEKLAPKPEEANR